MVDRGAAVTANDRQPYRQITHADSRGAFTTPGTTHDYPSSVIAMAGLDTHARLMTPPLRTYVLIALVPRVALMVSFDCGLSPAVDRPRTWPSQADPRAPLLLPRADQAGAANGGARHSPGPVDRVWSKGTSVSRTPGGRNVEPRLGLQAADARFDASRLPVYCVRTEKCGARRPSRRTAIDAMGGDNDPGRPRNSCRAGRWPDRD